MTPKKPSSPSPKSSLFTFFQEDKSFKGDFHRSYLISRKSLTIVRALLFLYSIFSLGLVIYQCQDYNNLFTLPYWSLALQTLYFGVVAFKSITKNWIIAKEGETQSQLLVILYEMVFSFQLFNFLYYCMVIVHKDVPEGQELMKNITWLSVTVFSFVAIWTEQVFNMVRFQLQHITLIIGAVVMNLLVSMAVNYFTEWNIYIGRDFTYTESFVMQGVLLITPMCHFMIGNKHYHHKKDEKSERRKKLSEALVSNLAFKDKVLKPYAFY